MANLSKERRDRMLAKLEELKLLHNDDSSIAALNEIENALREKKYGLVWEEHSEAVDDMLKENIPVLVADPMRRICKNEALPWNHIIEGDNLQALYLLNKTHHRRVDCIYIDPPYNSGARDWKYNNDYVDGNDEYRHSKWLSMMKSRLLLAKQLLNPNDSVLICTIDEKEYLRLGCLLEELFPEARIQMISSVINPHGANRKDMFARVEEYLYFVFLGTSSVCQGHNDMLNPIDKTKRDTWARLLRGGSSGLRVNTPNQYYPIFIREADGKYVGAGDVIPVGKTIKDIEIPEGCFALLPTGSDGKERCWGLTVDSFREKVAHGYIKFGPYKQGSNYRALYHLQSGTIKAIEKGEMEVYGKNDDGTLIVGALDKPKRPVSVWVQASHDSRVHGAMLLNSFFPDIRFSYPKSLYAVRDTLEFIVRDKPNALIVDFFAGSGTTLHAVNLLNAEDGGHRKCIMVTNNEMAENEQKAFEEQGIHKGDPEWEERGIAKYVTWPRTECSINGKDISGKPLKGNYLGSDIPMANGFEANVKYLKCDWIPRKPEDYLLSNALLLNVKELIELQTAREIDGIKNVIVYSKGDYKRIFENPELESLVESVWVNENIIFNTTEMKKLKAKNFKYIPREFFGQELKEVGEYV